MNIFHLPPREFWRSTMHEFVAACEDSRRQADSFGNGSKAGKSKLTDDDVRRLREKADAARAQEKMWHGRA